MFRHSDVTPKREQTIISLFFERIGKMVQLNNYGLLIGKKWFGNQANTARLFIKSAFACKPVKKFLGIFWRFHFLVTLLTFAMELFCSTQTAYF
jgi:hypothetical protein